MSIDFRSLQKKRISAFVQLGKVLLFISEKHLYSSSCGLTEQEFDATHLLVQKQKNYNGWFTQINVLKAMNGIATWLSQEKLEEFCAHYSEPKSTKNVAIIMAGNIPMVGFHDMLCVLLSGHTAIVKLSSDDKHLIPYFYEMLVLFEPELKDKVIFSDYKMSDYDAVIATGSNNSFNYFEQYFGKYPHVFRKNRTSVAVLTGKETREDLHRLGEDFFTFFGLGCRNVSHLLLPKNYKLDTVFEALVDFGEVVNHHKYANNYDYQRAIMMMNKIPFLENNFVIMKEDEALFSPLAQINYSYYANENELNEFISRHAAQIQAIVGLNHINFGSAQQPLVSDFADGVDTMEWLAHLN